MPRTTNKLTDAALRAARYKNRPVKMFDGGGLFLHVQESGRYWRLKYRHGGRERLLALGVYPTVTLAAARKARDEARTLLSEGIDPSLHRKAQKAAGADTFKAVADEWLGKQKGVLAPVTYGKAEWLLGLLHPHIGKRPVREIAAPELLAALRRIEARGTHETAHRARQKAGQVFRYAVATGKADRDPAADLKGALTPVKVQSRAAVTDPAAVGALLRSLDGYTGQPQVTAALRLAPLLFVRPGELRRMEWSELDLDAGEWRIPAAKTKMREAHVVPLSTQAVAILRDLAPLTGPDGFVFPGTRSKDRPLSENTLNAALRRMGYAADEMTAHGFRALASTRLNEMGWAPDIIERQLAHAERNKVRAAYNRAQHLDQRKRMMQAWADYLDGLRSGGDKVVALGKRA
jgi:integrase